MTAALVAAAGAALGFASSFHCVANCGAIASSIALSVPASSRTHADMARLVAIPHISRIGIYAIFGAVAGAFIGSLSLLLPLEYSQSVLQHAASIALIWTGLTLASVLPRAAGPERMLHRLISGRPLQVAPLRPLVAFGLAWGCAPCTMVYTALLSASMTGSAAHGAFFMLGFGVATMPSLIVLVMGQIALRRWTSLASAPIDLKAVGGLFLVVMGVANVAVPRMALPAAFCFTN